MTYTSEIFHKWFSFQIFDSPFSLENNAPDQIGFNSPKHTTHSNARIHFCRKDRTRATKSSTAFAISFYILLHKEPLEKSISTHTAALQHCKAYLHPLYPEETSLQWSQWMFCYQLLNDKIPPTGTVLFHGLFWNTQAIPLYLKRGKRIKVLSLPHSENTHCLD